MKRSLSLFLVPMLAVALGGRPAAARQPQPNLDAIRVRYHGGPLLTRVRVNTLFWGAGWKSSPLPSYFNNFFKALFIDGRFMANLAQYSTNDSPITNGIFGGSATDSTAPLSQVTDAQIQAEIQAQIAAGHLRKPDANTMYFVFVPPNVAVTLPAGAEPVNFLGYHSYADGSTPFAYAVILYDDQTGGDPHLMTLTMSHELAEAVTDPQVILNSVGWYDDNNGEIGDIPLSMVDAGRLKPDDVIDRLDGTDGWIYYVQKVWSLKDTAPVAFAPTGGQ